MRFLDQNSVEIAAFRARQQHSFAAEIARWKDQEASVASKPSPFLPMVEEAVPDGHRVHAPVHCSIWKLLAKPGERVEASQAILMVEAMKMELIVSAPTSGVVKAICCTVGHSVAMGDILAVIEA